MDGFHEKKWFVYLTDHHEGPYSLADIQDKMSHGQVTPGSYFWSEGMPDWTMMTEIPAFGSLTKKNSSKLESESSRTNLEAAKEAMTERTMMLQAPVFPMSQGDTAMMNGEISRPIVHEKSSVTTSKGNDFSLPAVSRVEIVVNPPTKYYNADGIDDSRSIGVDRSRFKKKNKEVSSSGGFFRFLKKVFFLLVFAGAVFGVYTYGYFDPFLKSPAVQKDFNAIMDFAQPQLLQIAEKFPALDKWISPIARLDDVSPEDYEELKAAAKTKLDQGPKAAIALSQADLTTPSFYVASNLPDGTQFDVYVVGVQDTLLNQLSFNAKIEANLAKKLAKTAAVKLENSQPLPRGEYYFYIVASDVNSEAVKSTLTSVPTLVVPLPGVPAGVKIIARKSYFLGGKRDATYTTRLKEFHDKLREKAGAELQEVKQFSSVLEAELGETNTRFRTLSASRAKRIGPAQKKAWADYEKRWSGLSDQLNKSFVKWTPEALKSEYFYGVLYQLVQQAFQSVQRVHSLHNAYFTSSVDRAAFNIQLGEAVSSAEGALQLLKSKISQAEKIPPTPNGMPRKEGL